MILYSFKMGDCEDPYLYASFPISEWQQTELGKWVMENSMDAPSYTIDPDPVTLGYRVTIMGRLTPEAETYFTLKYK
jgi:hypothetical protein